ncbi:hypothetical protein GHT06_013789 [Daphnia sinensis]|uniref:AIG1-type G domain-containing protein n=1 Tax=Daphnia sinensis TaxID=1820382 RepID=A0AAD5PVM3_9CRUS|nr:hypothetical protein GHT06_013789 [Daphnia sinensis]
MDRYVIEMAALGRHFQVGDLYNYRNDSILPLLDKGLSRDSIHSKISTEVVSKIQVESFCNDSGLSYEKWDRLGIDDHLRSSIAAGIIDEFSGSSRYLTDRCKPGQGTRTVVLRMESRKDLVHQEDIKSFCGFNQATHLIVGVVYGAQAYCVVTHDLADVEEEEAEEHLSKITSIMEKALKDNRNLNDFMEQFDDREAEHLARVKFRLYADLQAHSVREYCVSEAYKHCLHFVRHIQKPEFQNSTENAIAVVLCPLEFIVPSAGTLGQYRDVDADLVIQYSRISDSLNGIMGMADAARTTGSRAHRVPLRQFHDAVAGYQEKLQKSLKNEILKARANANDQEIERIIHIAQSHPLFKPSRLEQWLRFKQSEWEMIEKMANMKGVVFFADRTRLERVLADTFVPNFALVLRIPPVDCETNAMLERMRECLNKCVELMLDISDKDEDEDGLPWHMIQRKRKQVLDKIREFANHAEKNKHLEDGLQFSITFGDPGQGNCHYSVYEADNLLKDNLIALPHPPTDLRINYLTKDNAIDLKTSAVRISWNYPDTGYPHHFVVEYRPKGSCDKSWMQRKTTIPGEHQTIISFPTGSAIEIRVAVDTCIGRSDFTNVIDTGSICLNDLHTDGAHYPIEMKENAVWNYPSYAKLLFSIHSRCCTPSDNRRIAETFALENSVLIHRGQPNIHLLNVKENSIDCDFRWMDVGPSLAIPTPSFYRRDHKIIMLVGATGSGKSTLIDGMMNYILGVHWNDPFRFKCVRETHSQTSCVTAYTIRHQDGMSIPYSITIIDTPGYSKDTGVTSHSRKIERFLTHQNIRIDHIHAVCFVAASNDVESTITQPHTVDSVLSLFGKEVKDNIRLLITFADMVHPPVVDTCSSATFPFTSSGLTYNQFDNSVLYASNEEEDDVCFDQLFWRMDQENYGAFFAHLEKMNAKDLGSTRDVIQRRSLLNQSLREIERGLEAYLVNVENVRMFGRKIKEYGDQMEANKNFMVEQTDVRLLPVKCDKGYVCYNCRRCRRTCEGPVRSIRFDYIRGMKKKNKQCAHLFCPCPATEHEYQPFQWRHVAQSVMITTDEEMKAAYESNSNDKLTSEQLLEHCQNELKMSKATLFCLLARVGSSCLLLEATALRADTLSLADYLSLMKSRVAEEQAPGYVTRLEILNELQQSLSGNVQPTDKSPVIRDGIQMMGCDEPYELKFVDKFANSFAIGEC